MKALARPGVAQGSGGRATPGDRVQFRSILFQIVSESFLILPFALLVAILIPPPTLIVTVAT